MSGFSAYFPYGFRLKRITCCEMQNVQDPTNARLFIGTITGNIFGLCAASLEFSEVLLFEETIVKRLIVVISNSTVFFFRCSKSNFKIFEMEHPSKTFYNYRTFSINPSKDIGRSANQIIVNPTDATQVLIAFNNHIIVHYNLLNSEVLHHWTVQQAITVCIYFHYFLVFVLNFKHEVERCSDKIHALNAFVLLLNLTRLSVPAI